MKTLCEVSSFTEETKVSWEGEGTNWLEMFWQQEQELGFGYII